MRRTLTPLLCFLVAWIPSVAHAHEDVDEGVRLTGLAEFDEALAAFARAEAADDLTREDLVVLLESRAILLAAMGRTDAMERDLARLAALEPTRALPAAAPPEVLERFNGITARAARLELLAVPTWDVGSVTVRAVTEGDPGGLVQRIRVGARLIGRDYAFGDGRVQLVAADGSSVEYFAEAIGPGGAVIGTAGAAETPLTSAPPRIVASTRASSSGSDRRAPVDPEPVDRERGGGLSVGAWLAIGGGIALVAAAVIIAVVVASSQGAPDTALGGPMAVPP